MQQYDKIQIPKGATVKLAVGTGFTQPDQMPTVLAPRDYKRRSIESNIDYVLSGRYERQQDKGMVENVRRVMASKKSWGRRTWRVSANTKDCKPTERLGNYVCDVAAATDAKSANEVVIYFRVASTSGGGLDTLVLR